MTNDERQILLRTAELVRELIETEEGVNRSIRALHSAISAQLPGFRAAYDAAWTNSLFESGVSLRVGKITQEIEEIIQRLKRQD